MISLLHYGIVFFYIFTSGMIPELLSHSLHMVTAKADWYIILASHLCWQYFHPINLILKMERKIKKHKFLIVISMLMSEE